jgi:ABC-type multidrug transport system ATPase subunit/pSer/pThr/pTyr-binding forkhead associated (FHA) protein
MNLILKAYCNEFSQFYPLTNGILLVGRSEGCDIRLDSSWAVASGKHMQLRIDDNESIFVKDGCDGKPSTNGTKVNNKYLDSETWRRLEESDEIEIGNTIKDGIRIHIEVGDINTKIGQGSIHAEPNTDITIGRGAECNVTIDGPTVSRCHAIIRNRGGRNRLIDNSQNGIYINGSRVSRYEELQQNDEIKIGTHIFLWDGNRLIKETSGNNYRIDVRDLFLKGRISGTSISIEPGQLVAFVGGSGAGKSSLLTTIVGHNMDYKGSIKINGNELRSSYKSIKQEIGFVPQDDIVHMDLTIEEVLRYSARLKLPDAESQRNAVEKTLQELEISHRRNAKIRDLSGGQRKRVSIGVELLADPRILFLDEPTSGLDPGLDKRMMELLRSLADGGRTVALVTHATNNVMLCDQVVFLGRGGHLCYAGPPGQCAQYFGVSGDFADVYQRLEVTDEEIKDLALDFRKKQSLRGGKIANQSSRTNEHQIIGRAKQFLPQLQTLMSRDVKLLSRDLTSLVLNAVTAPAAAFMLAIAANNRDIFKNTDVSSTTAFGDAQRILFVIVCAAVWVGLSSSLQIIVKEREIFKRERAFNLLPEAYLCSKLIIMLGTAVMQSALVMATVSMLFEYPSDVGSVWGLRIGIASFMTLVAIGTQALFVSTLVKNSQQASSIAPLLLIPQLVFGGVLFNLSENAEGIYTAISSRWSMILMGCWTEITELLPKGVAFDTIPGAMSYENTISNVHEALTMLTTQACVMVTATIIGLLFYRKNYQ